MSRKLIVSADDFGLSPGVNAGIIAAHREGILTNASLMVCGAAAVEAVELARAAPTLAVGLHLVLLQGRAATAAAEIPDLVEADGMFGSNPLTTGFRYFFSLRLRSQLEREIRAQLDRYAATGLPLSHVDGHVNIHMHPTVLAILLDLAPSYRVGAIRLPREPLATSLRLDRRATGRKLVESLVFRALSAHAARKLRARGIRHPDHLFGLHQSGRMTEDYLLGVLNALPDGITEIYCHAGISDEEARRWRPADYDSAAEMAALCSPRVRAALRDWGIEPISYRQLCAINGSRSSGGHQKRLEDDA
jgi:hopanoid biosynthesis associated protein HpnK